MALVNPNIALSYKPVEIPQQRNMLADAASAMQLQQAAMQMDKYQRDADSLERVRQASIANGGPDNLPGMISALKQSSVEGHLKMALDLEQKLAAKTRYEAYLREQGIDIPAAGATLAPANAMAAPGAAPAMPTAPGAVPAPANAMVVPGAAPAPVNAMAVQTPQQIMNRIRLLSDIDYPGAKAEVDVLKAQLGEMQKKPTSVQEFEYGRENPAFAQRQLELKRASAPSTKVVLPPQETEFEKGLGGGQAKAILESRTNAEDAAQILATNQVGRDLLNSGAITGTGADFFVGLNKALQQAGVDFGYADAAANSQAYGAAMAQNVGKLIKQYGAGTGLSDADRNYATKAAAGEISMDEKAIRKILDINDRAANFVIDRHNKDVQGIKTNVPLTVEKPTPAPRRAGAADIPGQGPAPAAAPAARTVVRTGTLNGRRVVQYSDGSTAYAD